MSLLFLFVKYKTAYEMRISDWSSDVCSSDLIKARQHPDMVLGEGDARFVQRLRFETGIDVAGEGEQGLPLRQVGKIAKAVRIELRQARRDMHQLRQPLLRQVRRRSRQAMRLFKEMRRPDR